MLKGILLAVTLIMAGQAFSYVGPHHNVQNYVGTFPAQTEVYMDRTYGNVIVHNWNYNPIVCNGKVVGLTSSGIKAFSYARGLVLYPGQYANLYVYTNNYNPFVRVVPRIRCRFFHW
jgi:hypothetical protein